MASHSGLMFYFKEASEQHVLFFCFQRGSDELSSAICLVEHAVLEKSFSRL